MGSGLAALTAVRELRKCRVAADITVISPRDTLHYLPSSIWIPAGLRKREALKLPLARFFARHQVRHLRASVSGLNAARREITTDTGEVIGAEHIRIAAGGRFLRRLPGIENAIILDTLLRKQGRRDRFGITFFPPTRGPVKGWAKRPSTVSWPR